MKLLNTFFSAFVVLSLLFSCKSGNAHFSEEHGDTVPISYAVNLKMVDFPGYTKVEIRNPWDTTRLLHTYLLVPKEDSLPKDMPNGTVVRTPLTSSVIYSSVHNSLVAELGAVDAITGICDVQYIHQPELVDCLVSGVIADCGNSMSPNIERIIELRPGAILLSPFENSNGYGKLSQLGIPVVECADYMETSPLGRAEWMKFYGRLYGRTEVADSLFSDTEKSYLSTKHLADGAVSRPRVLMDRIFGAAWNVPGAYSTMGRFIEDAGGANPFVEYKISGSTGIAPEQVLYRAGNADIWLMRYSQREDMTLSQLKSDNAIYGKFAPFINNNVYGCNTSVIYFYEEIPFHPQWLLKEFVSLIHPELVTDSLPTRYFKKMKP